MPKVIVVCGPTASGKTALSIELAKKVNGEIVSADSMQIYREMNIGTAKPTKDEQNEAPHHMIDVADPGENYSVARYAQEASIIVDNILSKGKVAIICGGTGLYINALINGTSFAESGENNGIRNLLEQLYIDKGASQMLKELSCVDPDTAAKLHVNDKKRIIRALEVYITTGETISEHNRRSKLIKPRYDAVFIGITPNDRKVLYNRIDRRVDLMFKQGLEKEVRTLYDSGKLLGTASQAIGYKEMLRYIHGEISIDDASELIKQKSRNYAKRQLTWFKNDERVNWIEYSDSENIASLCQKATSFIL